MYVFYILRIKNATEILEERQTQKRVALIDLLLWQHFPTLSITSYFPVTI